METDAGERQTSRAQGGLDSSDRTWSVERGCSMSAALIISTVIFLAVLYSGYANGLFSSVSVLLMLTVTTAIAMSFYEPLAAIRPLAGMGSYAQPVCLAGLFVVTYFLLQLLVNAFAPASVRMKAIVNKLGGVGVSLLTATLITGFMGMFFYLLPWTGVHQSRPFIATEVVARGFQQLSWCTGGRTFDADGFFERLKCEEGDRICYRNLHNISLRLREVYSNWQVFEPLTQERLEGAIVNGTNLREDGESGGKGVGSRGVLCPCSKKPYVIRALKSGVIPHRSKGRVMQVYDAEPSHKLNGKPARMVLWSHKSGSGKIEVEIELVSEEQFKRELETSP